MIQIRSDMMLSVLRNVNEEQDIFMVSKCLLKDRLLNLRQVKIVILYWRNHLYCGIKMIISKASRMETLCLRRTEHLPCGGQAEDVKTKSNHEATDKQNTRNTLLQKRNRELYCSECQCYKKNKGCGNVSG